jgi:predicted transcriptional regulator
MLEKTRIQRAMLRLNEAGGFTAQDLAAATAASAPNVRKTLERASADGLIAFSGTRKPVRRGAPEKLFTLTEPGVAAITEAAARVYAALVAGPISPVLPKESVANKPGSKDGEVASSSSVDALDAALETLGTLRSPTLRREQLSDRLAVAAAELNEAARDTGHTGLRARELKKAVDALVEEVKDLTTENDPRISAVCARSIEVVERFANGAPSFDRVFELLSGQMKGFQSAILEKLSQLEMNVSARTTAILDELRRSKRPSGESHHLVELPLGNTMRMAESDKVPKLRPFSFVKYIPMHTPEAGATSGTLRNALTWGLTPMAAAEAAGVVSAYVSNNTVPSEELPALLSDVHAAIVRVVTGAQPVIGEAAKPAVSPKKSITSDYIICLEDGRKYKSLKRHLRTQYNLSPEEYREKWNLPSDYPMVAPAYAKARSALAKQMRLGEQRRRGK